MTEVYSHLDGECIRFLCFLYITAETFYSLPRVKKLMELEHLEGTSTTIIIYLFIFFFFLK